MDKPVAAVAGDAAAGRDGARRLPAVRHRGLPPRFSGFPLYVARRWLEGGARRPAAKGMTPFHHRPPPQRIASEQAIALRGNHRRLLGLDTSGYTSAVRAGGSSR